MHFSKRIAARFLHQTACPLDKMRLGRSPDSEVAREWLIPEGTLSLLGAWPVTGRLVRERAI